MASTTILMETGGAPLSMETGPDGTVYFLSDNGTIDKLVQT